MLLLCYDTVAPGTCPEEVGFSYCIFMNGSDFHFSSSKVVSLETVGRCCIRERKEVQKEME